MLADRSPTDHTCLHVVHLAAVLELSVTSPDRPVVDLEDEKSLKCSTLRPLRKTRRGLKATAHLTTVQVSDHVLVHSLSRPTDVPGSMLPGLSVTNDYESCQLDFFRQINLQPVIQLDLQLGLF